MMVVALIVLVALDVLLDESVNVEGWLIVPFSDESVDVPISENSSS